MTAARVTYKVRRSGRISLRQRLAARRARFIARIGGEQADGEPRFMAGSALLILLMIVATFCVATIGR